jgi:hypothetical protein
MDNPESMATFGKPDRGQRQTNTTQYRKLKRRATQTP